jgi:hypothetical protein
MRGLALRFRFPEQRRFLDALERLDGICCRHRITKQQALDAFDPIQTGWYFQDNNPLAMLPKTTPKAVQPAATVRTMLLADLSLTEREALCGGMDASPYLAPARELAGDQANALGVGRLVRTFHVCPTRIAGEYLCQRVPAYLEYHLLSEAGQAHFLCVPRGVSSKAWEVWWTDSTGRWVETRSIRYRIGPTRSGQDWALPLDRLPHWGPSTARQIRIVLPCEGSVAVGVPRLLR